MLSFPFYVAWPQCAAATSRVCRQDMDFFGELTPEEQKAADEKKRVIEEAKARGAAKAKLTKSMIIMDVKPWDDTTGAPALRGPAA